MANPTIHDLLWPEGKEEIFGLLFHQFGEGAGWHERTLYPWTLFNTTNNLIAEHFLEEEYHKWIQSKG